MKKSSYTLITIVLVIMLGGYFLMAGVNIWVEGKMKALLQEIDQIAYESLEVSVLRNTARLHQIHGEQMDSDTASHSYKIEEITISGFHLWSYLVHNEIHLRNIDIKKPAFTLYRTDGESEDHAGKTDKTLMDFPAVLIDQLEITKGDLQIYLADTFTTWFSGEFPTLQFHDLVLDSSTVSQSIPFQWSDMEFSVQMLSFRMSDLYHLNIEKMSKSENLLAIENLKIVSPYDKYQFQTQLPFEKAWVNLSVPRIEIMQPAYTSSRDTMGFSASTMVLNDADLHIYKDNRLPDYPHIKPLYSQLLRELPIHLSLDTVHVRDSDIHFQLQTQKDPPPGLVSFKNIDGTIIHLNNRGMAQPDFPRTTVHAVTNFMDESSLELNWSFDISNTQDAFVVSGRLDHLTDEEINHFVTPALHIEAEGAINHLAFNYAGNDDLAHGDMYIDYEALRINVLKKDGTSRHKWISRILNLILKNKLDGPVETKGLRVDRVKTKSFWHFLWLMVQEGSLETIK